MVVTEEDIKRLISIGFTNQIADEDSLSYFKERNFINRCGGEPWRQVSMRLGNPELINLFKGLVIVERDLGWIGGSVASAIWVYDVIQRRELDKDFRIADFGLRNCRNPWIPFGGAYHGKRTIEDYFIYQKERALISAAKADRYRTLLRRVQGRKKKRATAIAELRKLTHEERGQIRSELLEKYSEHSTIQKLNIIADDPTYPPEYFPLEWIAVTTEELESLPTDLIKRLYDKLSTKTKGPWKRFARELERLDDGL